MKKHAKLLLTVVTIIVLAMVMTSCEDNAKDNKLVMSISGGGLDVVMDLDAKGDRVTHMNQTITMDLTKKTPEEIEKIKKGCEDYTAKYAKYDFATYSYEEKDNKIIQKISTDTSEEDVKKLREAKLLPVSEDTNKLSLKATKKNLETQGFKVVEE